MKANVRLGFLVCVLAIGGMAFGGIDGAVRLASNVSDTKSAAISTQAQIPTNSTTFVIETWLKPTEFHTEDHFFSQDLSGNAGRIMILLANGKPRFQPASQ